MTMTRFYHGCSDPACVQNGQFQGYRPERGPLFLSRSVNVARRYGHPFVVELDIPDNVVRITVDQWLNAPCDDQPGNRLLIISGQSTSYDFPVDTLVVQSELEGSFERALPIEMAEPDDDLVFRHEPVSQSGRQFDVFLEDFYEGDEGRWVYENKQGGDESGRASMKAALNHMR